MSRTHKIDTNVMDKSSSFCNIKKHYIFVLIILTLNRTHSTYSSYSNNKNIKD